MTEDQMGILHTPIKPADQLITLFQDGHSTKDNVEELLELSHMVTWDDDTLKTIFWCGLDDQLYQQSPTPSTTYSLAHFIDYVLWLSGSSLTVSEVDGDTTTTQPQSPLSIPESPPKVAALPESRPVMAALAESHPIMAALPESRPAMAAESDPAAKLAAAPEPSAKMAASSEPSAKMAATPEPSAKMAAKSEPSAKTAATPPMTLTPFLIQDPEITPFLVPK
ncbi:hypothetical protein DPX16_20088 [Anabarilius grahami]|uniref:Uncharacterized protein n=1 Tax=Anabarilius grahami TaxID=495550 RepID=A0A3N0XT06_ANAGA|nr:hypothetical protein DPX16_20088 [Anabarilius grahami]